MQTLRKTLNDCTGKNALSFLGVLDNDGPEAQDVVEFHSLLVVSHLSALTDLSLYHTSIPWVVVATMDPASVASTLLKLKRSWEFCVGFCDGLPTTDKLYDTMFFTRFQPFRDVCVKAEYLTLCFANGWGHSCFLIGHWQTCFPIHAGIQSKVF